MCEITKTSKRQSGVCVVNLENVQHNILQQTFTYSKLTIETLENMSAICSKSTSKTPDQRH